jgi:hypothetical protein
MRPVSLQGFDRPTGSSPYPRQLFKETTWLMASRAALRLPPVQIQPLMGWRGRMRAPPCFAISTAALR